MSDDNLVGTVTIDSLYTQVGIEQSDGNSDKINYTTLPPNTGVDDSYRINVSGRYLTDPSLPDYQVALQVTSDNSVYKL
jgi:hypothetical protein